MSNEALEKYMVDKVNNERTRRGLKYLVHHPELASAAARHSAWMLLNDIFSHTGVSGSDPKKRIQSAGYLFSGTWSYGENIAWVSLSGILDRGEVDVMHASLMASTGHKANILGKSFDQVGIGIEVGEFKGFKVAMCCQCFASSSAE